MGVNIWARWRSCGIRGTPGVASMVASSAMGSIRRCRLRGVVDVNAAVNKTLNTVLKEAQTACWCYRLNRFERDICPGQSPAPSPRRTWASRTPSRSPVGVGLVVHGKGTTMGTTCTHACTIGRNMERMRMAMPAAVRRAKHREAARDGQDPHAAMHAARFQVAIPQLKVAASPVYCSLVLLAAINGASLDSRSHALE